MSIMKILGEPQWLMEMCNTLGIASVDWLTQPMPALEINACRLSL